MTDTASLQTASAYINNQLLSRGLLREGRPIDFADPAGDGNTVANMGRIISVVNDLILRRDRDAEHRESLSAALRSVRTESLRQSSELQRAVERLTDEQRRVDLVEAAEAHVRAQLASAESATRRLRDEATRMRALVAQTRAACAHEVRKRDRQIDGLKRAVADAGRARGERRNPAVTSIVIGGAAGGARLLDGPGPEPTPSSAVYDLRSETNAFLAELAHGLSDDNEALLGLVRHTSQQLKAMSGFDETNAATNNSETEPAGVADVAVMGRDMEDVLEHLRVILTNPSFVPIEEVMQRESEIGRLRDGWEKMEGRWQEAVHLMDGWRRRMVTNGPPVDVEEIKMGLRLSPVRVRNVAETVGEDEHGEEEDSMMEVIHEEEEEMDEVDLFQPKQHVEQRRVSSLHLVPAPGGGDEQRLFEEDDEEVHSDVSSAESSMLDERSADEEPNVLILAQSLDEPEMDVEEVHVVKEIMTIKEVKEMKEVEEVQEPAKTETKRQPAAPARRPTVKPGLRPSDTAANRGEAKDSDTMRGTKRPADEAAMMTQQPRAKAATTRAGTTAAPAKSSAATATATRPQRPTPLRPATVTRSRPAAAVTRPAASRPRPATGARRVEEAKVVKEVKEVKEARTNKTDKVETVVEQPEKEKLEKSPIEQRLPPSPARQAASPGRTAASPARTTASPSRAAAAVRARSRSPTKPAPLLVPAAASVVSDAPASPCILAAASSRLPVPANGPPPVSPGLSMASIAAKLAASEREADAARVRAKLRAVRGLGVGGRIRPVEMSGRKEAANVRAGGHTHDDPDHDPNHDHGHDPIKRSVPETEVRRKRDRDQRRTSKAAARRRSTLNSLELASLMAASVEE